MDIQDLKDRIVSEDRIRQILESLGMHSIKDKGKYYTCGMPDGDNKSSTIIYKESLNVDAYTRNITDNNSGSDILSLVMFVRNEYLTHSIKWICEICDFDYYNRDYQKPMLLSFLNELSSMNSFVTDSEEFELKPIDEKILKYYTIKPHKLFYEDGINHKIQRQFEVGYDLMEHRITIPIRDENGVLVGIKGRLNKRSNEILDFEAKYNYIERCNKNKILFGLDKAYEHIKSSKIVYVVESEKGVMQGFSENIKNVVSIGGHILSKNQVEKLSHLGVEVCLCYDDLANMGKDNMIDKDFYKKEREKFIPQIKVSYIIDKNNEIIGHKESPFDNLDMWEDLLKMKKTIYPERREFGEI